MSSDQQQNHPPGDLHPDADFYASYIREVTDDGNAIVDCLISIMEVESVGAKPYERLDAQLLLDSIGFGQLAVEQESHPQQESRIEGESAPPASPGPANGRRPKRPAFVLSEETLFHLPSLVRQKTDRGQKMADFLISVVRGELSDFRPHHRIRAARQLAARAYSKQADPDPVMHGLRVDDTRALIETLIAGLEDRKARGLPVRLSAQLHSLQTNGAPAQGRQPGAVSRRRQNHNPKANDGTLPMTAGPDHSDQTAAVPTQDPRDRTVLDDDYASPCPHQVHLPGCSCVPDEDDERDEPDELDELDRAFAYVDNLLTHTHPP